MPPQIKIKSTLKIVADHLLGIKLQPCVNQGIFQLPGRNTAILDRSSIRQDAARLTWQYPWERAPVSNAIVPDVMRRIWRAAGSYPAPDRGCMKEGRLDDLRCRPLYLTDYTVLTGLGRLPSSPEVR
jgi:hypothetical protein